MIRKRTCIAFAAACFAISSETAVRSEVVCGTCNRVVVLDSKKAACFGQQYEAVKRWFEEFHEEAAAIHLRGCVPGLKLTFRGVQESFGTRRVGRATSDPDSTIKVTEIGLDCLRDKLENLALDKLDPETIFDMKRECL